MEVVQTFRAISRLYINDTRIQKIKERMKINRSYFRMCIIGDDSPKFLSIYLQYGEESRYLEDNRRQKV